MNDQEFNQLLESILDENDGPLDFDPDTLNPEQQGELIEFLTLEPRLREAFSQPGSFAAGVMKALECDAPANREQFRKAIVRGNKKRPGVSQPSLWRALPWGIAAILLLLLADSYLWWPVKSGPGVVQRPEGIVLLTPSSPAAILVAEAEAEFDPLHAPDGIRCDPGEYVLRSGAIHLRLLNGVDLALEGPARFLIRDSFELDLTQGRCRALVPETGHGFTVNTSQMEVIDLGTEFGVSVDADGQASEVRVFDGMVDVVAANSTEKTRLNTDDALRISSAEGVTAPRISTGEFPDIRSIGFSQWQHWRNKIAQDPDLIAYLPMQGNQKGEAEVISSLPETPVAQLIGAHRVTGRWPGKGALLFEQDGDRVELDLGKNHEEFTIAMWVKAERWDYRINALITSNGWEPGALHLQTSRDAGWRVHGSIRFADHEESARAYSSEAMEIGQWQHVAYVLSKRTGQFQVFINGVAGSMNEGRKNYASKVPANTPINPGMVRLGDWEWDSKLKAAHMEGGHPKQKGFRGRIDEFVAISRALSQEEIDEMVTRGRPSFLWPE